MGSRDVGVASGSSLVFLDSPSTTSAVTYKLQMQCGAGGGDVFLNRGGSDYNQTDRARAASSITVMEISG